MRLPELPYSMGKTRRQITQFLGLNLSENTREGEMTDTLGLTTENYPTLSQRGSWAQLDGYTAPTDVFEWDGKLVVVDGGTLYYDGVALDSVTDGRKQFAVVNTKLCIWPDKTYIDLTNGKYGYLDAEAVTDGTPGNVTLGASSITAALFPKVKTNLTSAKFTMGHRSGVQTIYTYGSDIDALRALWDGSAWSIEELETEKGIQGAWYDFEKLEVGEIFIPKVSGSSYRIPTNGIYAAEDGDHIAPERADFTVPYYAVVTDVDGYIGQEISEIRIYYDVYNAEVGNVLFSGKFNVGDRVEITGVPFGLYTGEEGDKEKITAIDDETNTLTFEGEIFQTAPDIELSTITAHEQAAGEYITLYDGTTLSEATFYAEHLPVNIPAGALVLIRAGEEAKLMQIIDEDGTPLMSTTTTPMDYESWQAQIEGETYRRYLAKPGTDAISFTISVRRQVPDMDYICESGNRLWGVSNAQENRIWNEETKSYDTFTSRCVYASALGLPERFWDFEGVSTDSYQVAVGGEGDFTAICDFNGGVCCWKEQRLYRITGSYPAEYYMHDYQMAGVQAGSFRSLAIENEVLYYKGVLGVYAYTGGTPTLISSNLGTKALYNAAGGTDSKRYYIGCADADGEKYLFSYDLTRGLWLKEAEWLPEVFARLGETLYMLSDGVIYYPTDDVSGTEWLAEFVPFTETEHIRKGHTKILLRLDMDAGSALKVEIKEDSAAWRLVLVQTATNACTLNIPIRLGRCDRYAIRLSGVGGVMIRSMAREFTVGSEV